MIALHDNNFAIVKILLKYGASVNVKNSRGGYILDEYIEGKGPQLPNEESFSMDKGKCDKIGTLRKRKDSRLKEEWANVMIQIHLEAEKVEAVSDDLFRGQQKNCIAIETFWKN